MNDNILIYQQKRTDRLISCLVADGMVRAALIDGTNLVREAQRVHNLSRVATAALGRQLMMTAIMSADLKGELDLVSTIFKGDGPGGSMICTGNSRLEVKGSVMNGDVELPPTPEGKLDVGGFVAQPAQALRGAATSASRNRMSVLQPRFPAVPIDFAYYYACEFARTALVHSAFREDATRATCSRERQIVCEAVARLSGRRDCQGKRLHETMLHSASGLDAGEKRRKRLSNNATSMSLARNRERREPKYVLRLLRRERWERALISWARGNDPDMIEQDHGGMFTCRF